MLYMYASMRKANQTLHLSLVDTDPVELQICRLSGNVLDDIKQVVNK